MRRHLPLLASACGATILLAACASAQKKIAPKMTYKAGFLASSDGRAFHPLLELMNEAEKAKPFCTAINRRAQTKAQYLVERSDQGVSLKIKECESPISGNCSELRKCLEKRPVAWLARASGRTPEQAGVIYTDWIGRCGGQVAVNFYYGPQSALPVEKVGCAEPLHEKVDTAYDMFMVPRPEYLSHPLVWEETPAAGPYIEALLARWNSVSFNVTAFDLQPSP